MSLRTRARPTPLQTAVNDSALFWSALGGLKILSIGMEAGQGNPGKRKASAPPSPPSREASSESNSSDGGVVKMIVINFDGTLTRAGPFTRDPALFRGVSTPGWTLSESPEGFQAMTKEEHVENFGGEAEIENVRAFFAECMYPVDGDAIKIYIVCNGPKAAAKLALQTVGLFQTAGGDPLITGIIGRNDEPFASDSDIGKWAAVEMLQEREKLKDDEILFVASKDSDMESVRELGIYGIQAQILEGIGGGTMEHMREVTGLLTPEQEAEAADEKGASSAFADLLR